MARYLMVTVSLTSDPARRLAAIRSQIAAAATRAQRPVESITLVAVSKTQPAAAIAALADLGQRDFGENYLQEAIGKIQALADRSPKLVWHFIGQLQSNKTRPVAEHFDWVHTVDRLKIAERLSQQRSPHGPPLQVCLQVKLGDEPTKAGVTPTELPALLRAVAALPRLQVRGLMALPPAESDEDAQRRWFAELRQLLMTCQQEFPGLDTLSMGMSGDLTAAILEGSTLIRVGTALFGERLQSPS